MYHFWVSVYILRCWITKILGLLCPYNGIFFISSIKLFLIESWLSMHTTKTILHGNAKMVVFSCTHNTGQLFTSILYILAFGLEEKLATTYSCWYFFVKENMTVDQCILLSVLHKFIILSEKGWIKVVLAYNIHWRKHDCIFEKTQMSASLYWNEVKGELFIHMAWQPH